VHHAASGAGGLHKVDGDGKGGDSTPKGGVGGRVVLCPQGTVRGARAREGWHSALPLTDCIYLFTNITIRLTISE
jgi:hypothetical protein